jgi:NAD(P)-dependent dehydrogenase (short-subunit alcohol dehydrogenase family)
MLLNGRDILITGGSVGIGKAIAHHCLAEGANVAICARDADGLKTAADELKRRMPVTQRVLAQVVDVSSPDAVEAVMTSLQRENFNITGVVNAAGILGPIGALDETSVEEWIATVQINLIGTMLVCRAALPHFRKHGYGKIVNFSGGGATSPRSMFGAYAASKAAVVRFTENLAQELIHAKVFVNAIAPGAVNTRMLKQVLDAGRDRAGDAAYEGAVKQKAGGGASADRAADLCVTLLSAGTDGLTGRLISAVWDPWEDLSLRKDQIMSSDVYTLRRIVPSDRGFNWE